MKSLDPGRLFSVALLSILAALPAGAHDSSKSLSAELEIEQRLLERAGERYRDSRSAERDAVRDLEELSNAQDTLLNRVLREALAQEKPPVGDEGGPPAEAFLSRRTMAAERELAVARELTLAMARESAALRRGTLDRVARIRELRTEIAKLQRVGLVDESGLDGLWQIELVGAGIDGLIDFSSQGTLVTGDYRLSNGAQGSVRGTIANGQLELDRINWATGFDTTLRGQLDPPARRIEGSWTAVDVSGGSPSSGTWTAQKVSREDLANR